MRRLLLAFGLLGGLVGTADIAVAQDCVQDQYGRVICGQRVQPYYQQQRPRYYEQQRPRYEEEPQYQRRQQPGLNLNFGGGGGDDDRRYAPPSNRNRTGNGCPPNYTVQDGLCKPYTGR
jgi:hypothetical protein